jgi:hypothetical protein
VSSNLAGCAILQYVGTTPANGFGRQHPQGRNSDPGVTNARSTASALAALAGGGEPLRGVPGAAAASAGSCPADCRVWQQDGWRCGFIVPSSARNITQSQRLHDWSLFSVPPWRGDEQATRRHPSPQENAAALGGDAPLPSRDRPRRRHQSFARTPCSPSFTLEVSRSWSWPSWAS